MIALWSYKLAASEGFEVLVISFCVRGFVTHPCPVIFYKHLNWIR